MSRISRTILLLLWSCISAQTAYAQDVALGERIYQNKADCKYCHGEAGDGDGDPQSAGAAVDLRASSLNRQQMFEVIACGRPNTEMPHFDRDAYVVRNCYGLSADSLGAAMPRNPHSTSLTEREIDAVVDYVLSTIVGKYR